MSSSARCHVHGFILGPGGTCLRCRKEAHAREASALRSSMRKLYAAAGVLFGVLIVFAACRSISTAFAESPRSKPTLAATESPVVVYTAPWCGSCKAAKRWLNAQNIAYVDRDIESDQAARTEVVRLAGGPKVAVPMFVVDGELLPPGFDPQAVESAMQRHGLR